MEITNSQLKTYNWYLKNSDWFKTEKSSSLNEKGIFIIMCEDIVYKINRRGGLTSTLLKQTL
jgi:hypothetical protein